MTALESLLETFDVCGLVRSPAPEDDVSALANDVGTELSHDTSISGVNSFIARHRPEAVVVSSFHRILPEKMLGALPFVNVHYAPLPRYRGRATVNWAIINGELSTAISIHDLAPRLDAGGILFQQHVAISDTDTAATLYARLNTIQRAELGKAVHRRLEGDMGVPQDDSKATYVCARLPQDGEIDWSQPAESIHRLVRALVYPFPGAFTWLGNRQLTVKHCEVVTDFVYEGRVPGRVVHVDRQNGAVDVLAGDRIVRLLNIESEGRDAAPAEIIHSTRATLGTPAAAAVAPPGISEGAAFTEVQEGIVR
ncbi:formyltransferase family protein [Arthrobacter sp. NPDC089319]|uniref:methionyl-tRNA formyltransferase n=1 Tax=Arthrobacter sp. NPDC089319 TaxID=3155915 RepID=UPI003423D677